MKLHRTTLLKTLSTVITLVTMLILAQGQARADEVTLSGFTTGAVLGIPQLTFAGNPSFTNTTSLGIGALSGANNLGTFFLSTSPGATAPGPLVVGGFYLNITFTSPAGIRFRPLEILFATIEGTISPNVNQGGLKIDFDNVRLFRNFNDGSTAGTFSFVLPDVFIETGQSAALTAGTTGFQEPIPEPATLLLLGTGLTGIAAKLRKRRKAGRDLTNK